MLFRSADIAARFKNAFASRSELQLPYERDDCLHAWHLFMLRLNLGQLSIGRAQFIQELKQRNIGTSVHFIPLHLQPYYRDLYGLKPDDFPVARREYEREISLPVYSKMSDADVDDVIDAVFDTLNTFSQGAQSEQAIHVNTTAA